MSLQIERCLSSRPQSTPGASMHIVVVVATERTRKQDVNTCNSYFEISSTFIKTVVVNAPVSR